MYLERSRCCLILHDQVVSHESIILNFFEIRCPPIFFYLFESRRTGFLEVKSLSPSILMEATSMYIHIVACIVYVHIVGQKGARKKNLSTINKVEILPTELTYERNIHLSKREIIAIALYLPCSFLATYTLLSCNFKFPPTCCCIALFRFLNWILFSYWFCF